MGAETISTIYDGCVFDLCGLEGRPSQNDARCQAYAKLTDKCIEFAAKNKIKDWEFNWRGTTNCRKFLTFKQTKYY